MQFLFSNLFFVKRNNKVFHGLFVFALTLIKVIYNHQLMRQYYESRLTDLVERELESDFNHVVCTTTRQNSEFLLECESK